MKPIVLHPGSLVAGAVIALVPLLALGAQTLHVQQVRPSPARNVFVHVAGIPDSNDLVLVREEDGPYTVPTGRLLVITGLGVNRGNAVNIGLNVDGTRITTIASVLPGAGIQAQPSIRVEPGSTVLVSCDNAGAACSAGTFGRATGFLVAVRP